MEYLIIDRFEGGTAVLEKADKTTVNLPVYSLPKGAKEGDVIAVEDGMMAIDDQETRKRKEKIIELNQKIWEE